MAYELILPHDTQNEIRDYISSRFVDLSEQLAALAAITSELEKLAVNPALGSPHYGGPFETRPVYRFTVSIGDVPRHVQVAYAVLRKDRKVVISGFTPISPIL